MGVQKSPTKGFSWKGPCVEEPSLLDVWSPGSSPAPLQRDSPPNNGKSPLKTQAWATSSTRDPRPRPPSPRRCVTGREENPRGFSVVAALRGPGPLRAEPGLLAECRPPTPSLPWSSPTCKRKHLQPWKMARESPTKWQPWRWERRDGLADWQTWRVYGRPPAGHIHNKSQGGDKKHWRL